MTPAIVKASLIVAASAIALGAVINTVDWVACTINDGGQACNESRNIAAGAWTALGMNALALATSVMKDDDPPSQG